jgi:hypothetical protein
MPKMSCVFAERLYNAEQQNNLSIMKRAKYMFNESNKVKRALF